MYVIVSILGSILREVYLPNPFVNVFATQSIADLFNLVLGGAIIGFLSYFLTGCIYERGKAPIIGSFLYTLNYALITLTFYEITLLIKSIITATMVYSILYILLCTFLSNLRARQYNF